MTNPSAYERLTARFKLIATIGECASMLGWDAAASCRRAEERPAATSSRCSPVLRHAHLTAPEVEADLAAAETSDPWEAANLQPDAPRLCPRSGIAGRSGGGAGEAPTRTARRCGAWRVSDGDFSLGAAAFGRGAAADPRSSGRPGRRPRPYPYDALMDGYQRGIRAADVARSFPPTRISCPPRCQRRKKDRRGSQVPIRPPDPFRSRRRRSCAATSRNGSGWILTMRGLISRRIPFSGGTPTDVRITTRYLEDDFASGILAVVHETGHALYERGLPSAYARQPVGEAAGMATHESQSLIVEMQAFRSDAFLSWLGGRLHAAFGGSPEPYRLENLGRLWRRVERSFIRVDADELTYPAHVILRFRLEQAMIAGDLTVADLPGAWNDGFSASARASPRRTMLQGCLQDIHWYDGAFGYFPSYTLGAMAAAQLMAGGAGAGGGPGRGVRARRSRAASGVASGSCARRRKPPWLPGNLGASDGPGARSARVSDASAAALSGRVLTANCGIGLFKQASAGKRQDLSGYLRRLVQFGEMASARDNPRGGVAADAFANTSA